MGLAVSTVPETPAAAPTRGARRHSRIEELDMTKGVLVIFMVVYHTLNYSTDYTLSFIYMPFLPPSFILITGFLVGRLYLQSQRPVGTDALVRSAARGLRLVAIFTVLNLLAQLVGRNKPSGPGGQFGLDFFDYWIEIYILGGAAAAFEVLLPIAYLLILAPILLLLARASRWIALIAAVAVVFAAIAFERCGEQFPNLTLLSAGFLGVIAGSLSGNILQLGRYWLVFVAAYVAYAIILRAEPQTVFTQLLGASLALVGIFASCAALGTRGFSRQRIVMLGKYSLLAYIFQIAFLQALSRVIGRYPPWSARFFLEMAFVVISMICVVEITNWLRHKNRPFASTYNTVLG